MISGYNGQAETLSLIDWYERQHELEPEQIFTTIDGSVVKLDRRVPGDGTKWYVADWMGHWSYEDSTIEPGDLVTRLPDNWNAATGGRSIGTGDKDGKEPREV